MKRGKLILVTGGARSGKSTFAERYAVESDKRVVYIATARADDEEMKVRIENHRRSRPAEFITVEEMYCPHRVIEEQGERGSFFLVDCLTLLLNNYLFKEEVNVVDMENKEAVERRADDALKYSSFLAAEAKKSSADVLVVTNEIGMGIVPENFLGRVYRDMIGKANQFLAEQSDEVWFIVSGVPVKIK